MTPRRVLLLGCLAAASVWGAAIPAAAGCPAPLHSDQRRLNNADIAFIGTVDSTDDTGRIANVTVESVWKGDVDEHVQVNGVTNPYSVAPGMDSSFEVGRRYLFVPGPGDGEVFKDGPCSLTRPWRSTLARHASGTAATVDGALPTVDPQAEQAADEGELADTRAEQPPAGNGRWSWVAAAVAVAIAVILVVLAQRRRSRAG